MASKLGRTVSDENGQSPFIGLSAELANALKPDQRMTSLSYASQREELNVELLLRDYAEIDTLKSTLAARGVTLEATNSEQEERGVRSRMRVRYQ